MLLDVVIWIVVITLTIVYICKGYKECKDILDKLLFVSTYFVVFIPILLFYFDKYNFPSFLGWSKGVDTQNWLSFFSSYFSSIVGAIISSVVLIVVTVKQMDRTFKENQERDREERRINNMPLLNYYFYDYDKNIQNRHSLETNITDGIIGEINFGMKNISPNAIRKTYIVVSGEVLKNDYAFELEQQSTIDKDEEKNVLFLLKLVPGIYGFKYKIYYQDLLFNWYVQELDLHFQLYPISNGLRYDTYSMFNCRDEKLLKKKPNIKLNNKSD